MTAIVIFLAVALAICIVLLFARSSDAPQKGGSSQSPSFDSRPRAADTSDVMARVTKAEADLEKKRAEVEELKAAQGELKAELKDAKKKLYDAKTSHKSDEDLANARAQVEREASVQLDQTRAELSAALQEIQKLKADNDGARAKRRAEPAPAVVAAPAPKEQVVIQKVIRELNDADKAKMNELEQKAARARFHEIELERELKQSKGRAETQARQLREVRKEAQLAKDKFRAVEARLNRTLLERDMTVRALRALEKLTGQNTTDRIELTAEEVADSDRRVAAQQAAQDKAESEARAKLEAEAEARNVDVAAPPEAPASAPTPVTPTA